MQLADVEKLYVLLTSVFDRHPDGHIDQQLELSEKLQLVKVLCSEKPSFFAMTHDPDRFAMYNDLSGEIGDQTCLHGSGELPVYFVGRALKIDDDTVRSAFTDSMHHPQKIFWLTCDEEIANIYRSARVHTLSENVLLGYPRCCSDWHFDCYFARGIEAFYAIFRRRSSTDGLLKYVKSEWIPTSGWFLPDELYFTGLLIGEQRFPFLSHLACPACRSKDDSPSAILNETYRSLAHRVDHRAAEQVRLWAEELQIDLVNRINSVPRMIRDASYETGLIGLEKDLYERHRSYCQKWCPSDHHAAA